MNPRVTRLLSHAHYPGLLPVYGRDYRVHLGPAPNLDYPTAMRGQPAVIYWWGKDDPYDFLHEVGHVANYVFVSDSEQGRFRNLIGGPPRSWWWPPGSNPMTWEGPDPYCEGFANLYAEAQLHRLGGVRFRHRLRRLIR